MPFDHPTRRIRLVVSYDGTNYHGWQVQPGLPTIQATFEQVISEIEEAPTKAEASGRTDRYVHALAQTVAVTITNPVPVENLVKALNRLLPKDIRVLSAEQVPLDFHPRFDAVSKTYEYRIFRGEICPPFLRHFVLHHPYPLNEAAMRDLAPRLEGEHDFTAFAASDEKDLLGHSKVRKIFSSVVARQGDLLTYRVRGSGFLKHMVRNITGVLLEAGKGNLSEADLLARLQPGSGIPPGPSLPGSGLFLISVEY